MALGGYEYNFRDNMPPSDEASGALEEVAIRKADNGGWILRCRFERGMPEEYVFEKSNLDGAMKYIKKQMKALGEDMDDEDD